MTRYKGITSDSREVKKDFIFVAIPGLTHDGHNYINEAIKNGASLVVGEKDLDNLSVAYKKVSNSKEELGKLASEFYGNPSSKLKVIGVTGTKGKTTTSHLIHHILVSLGKKTGLISSITTPGSHVTTPDVVSLNKTVAKLVEEGYEYVVIEVSSHGIDQGRVMGIKFDVAALTNIAPEHLDYHKTFKEYKRTKLSFLKGAKTLVKSRKDTQINVLPGKFNNLNAQLAIDVVTKLGIDEKEALKTLNSFKLPEGRLEEIKNNKGFRVFIDFAHTPESLEEVLNYLKIQTKGKLITVFGCAGERDPRKRPKMGKISTRIADLSVFTAEDPRSEDIFDILKSMESGAIPGKFILIPDRKKAIYYALSKAEKGDTVSILGKGHEKSMNLDGIHEIPWSDLKIVRKYMEAHK